MTSNAMKLEISQNQILYTNQLFAWMQYFSMQKDTIIFSPLTKVGEVLNLKSTELVVKLINDLNERFVAEAINGPVITQLVTQLNQTLALDVVSRNEAQDKLLKVVLEINEQAYLNQSNLLPLIKLIDKYAAKQTTILLVEVPGAVQLLEHSFAMVNLVLLTNRLEHLIHWGNLEQLVILDKEEPFYVLNKEKFKLWLEEKTRTVLTLADLENYFNNEISTNTLLIAKALRNL